MSSVSVYQERAKRCAEQAQLVTSPADRAHWLQLASEWMAVSRIQFHRLPPRQQRSDAYGLWRGGGLRGPIEAKQ
jgi:hypothetical protein